jgi:hypothetical protein
MTTPERVKRWTRYAIQVVYPSGETAYLRYGPIIGEGEIVQFHNRARAEAQLEFIRAGLDEGEIAHVVVYPTHAR